MFNKIRRNFIIVSMAAISFVLIIFIASFNMINYHMVNITCDNIINLIDQENPPMNVSDISNPGPTPGQIGDNRFFVAVYQNNSFIITTMKVESITQQDAISIAQKVKESGSLSGYYGYYRYNVRNGNRYIFLDATNQLSGANNTLKISIYSSLAGLFVVFLIIYFGSKIVLKPVKESYEKQKKFITNASHNLKTPLTIISANNELIELKEGESEYTKNISKEINKMNVMIKEFVQVSKMNEKGKIIKEKFNLSSLVLNTVNEFKLVYEDLTLNTNIDIEPNLEITNSKEEIRQMLTLILDNARKYALKNINISLKEEKNHIVFLQSNDTSGIDEGNLDYYMDRFYRSNNTRESREGSGIGLSALKELSTQTKVKINIYGENNIFNIKLTF